MKNVLLIMLLCAALCAEKVTVKCLANGRTGPKGDWVAYVCPGCVFDVKSDYCDWLYVELLSETDHTGKKGWTWARRVDETKGEVIVEGVSLRSSPNKPKEDPDSNLIAKVRVGAKLKVLKRKRTWVELTGECLSKPLWVWVDSIIPAPAQ